MSFVQQLTGSMCSWLLLELCVGSWRGTCQPHGHWSCTQGQPLHAGAGMADIWGSRAAGGVAGCHLTQDDTLLIPAVCLRQGGSLLRHRGQYPWGMAWGPQEAPTSILDESVPFPSSRSPYTQTETLLEVTLKIIKYTPLLVEEASEDLAEGVGGRAGTGDIQEKEQDLSHQALTSIVHFCTVESLLLWLVAKTYIEGSQKQPSAASAWGLQAHSVVPAVFSAATQWIYRGRSGRKFNPEVLCGPQTSSISITFLAVLEILKVRPAAYIGTCFPAGSGV